MSDHRKGQLLLLAAAALWSIGGALAKWIALPGPTMACYRALFAALALLPFLWLRGARPSFRPAMLAMACCFIAMNLTYVTAITKTTAANAIILQYTAPIWMFLGSVFWLGEPMERRSLVALALGMAGVVIILVGRDPADTLGIVLGLIAGFFYAGVVLFLRLLRDHDPFWLTFLNHAAAGLIGLALLWAVPSLGPVRVAGDDLFGLVLYGGVQMALPYVIFSMAMKRVTPQEAGILTLLEPVLNPIITFLTVGEVPAASTVVGGTVILGAVALRYVGGDGGDDDATDSESARPPAVPSPGDRNAARSV